ncbi:hypothetical protein QYE76_014295 [Lolium multiflorum]|uniref:F-box domain-containing protein n=1 Tax=Lolium multiflorum TaxID=4521 RepID=A0AAD8U494_LOLMU|nr:hypothetical protein QYE76_014295 [Lolium multiflorum]
MSPPPPVLMDELVEEVLRRLPPHDPACLVRASAVCKPWRRILAAPRFRRSYREFHRTPPVLGFFNETAGFVPGPALFPASHHRPLWNACLDCRHGRALFATYTSTRYYEQVPSGFTVLDPLTGRRHRMPFPAGGGLRFSAAVLCAAAQGCDHHGCCDEEGHFLVIFISAGNLYGATSARVYSSETGAWSDLVFTPEPNVMYGFQNIHVPSVLAGDAVYFNREHIVKYQLGTRRLSMFEKPAAADYGALVMAEDGVLGFAAVVDDINLAMWSRETAGPDTEPRDGRSSGQVVFVSTLGGCYIVDLKSGGARMFQSFWPKMDGFLDVVREAWTAQSPDPNPFKSLDNKLRATAKRLSSWSTRSIGSVKA